MPSARIYPKYLIPTDSIICGIAGTNDVSIFLYVNETEYTSYSTNSDSIIKPGGETIILSSAAQKGENEIKVKDENKVLNSTHANYYLKFKNLDRTCFLYYSISSIKITDANIKTITLEQPLEWDVPNETEIIFHTSDRPAGWFNIDVSSSLSEEGSYDVSVRVNKTKIYSTDALTLFYDANEPNIIFSDPTFFNSDSDIYFTVSDSSSGIATVLANLTYPNETVVPLTVEGTDESRHVFVNFTDNGEYTLTVFARDNAGLSSSNSTLIYFDNSTPKITLLSPTNFTTKTINLSYKYLDNSVADCTLWIDGDEVETIVDVGNDTIFSYSFNVTQPNYSTPYSPTIRVECKDPAQNTASLEHPLYVSYLPKELFWNYKPTFSLITWLVTNVSPFNFLGFSNVNDTEIEITSSQGLLPLKRNSTISTVDNPLINNSYVLYSQSEGDCYFLVNSSEADKFKIGSGIRFQNHTLNNYTLYKITDLIDYRPSKNEILYNISPCLVSDISSGETISIYDSSGYPSGWFNLSLELFPGVNNVSVILSRFGEQGYSTLNNPVVYDNFAPQINVTQPPVCMISPEFVINVYSYSPLDFNLSSINISNSTDTIFYLNGSNLESNFSQVLEGYKYKYILNLNEFLTGILNDGDYNLTLTFTSLFGKQSTKTVVFSKDSLIGRIPSIQPLNTQVIEPLFEFNWSALTDAHAITYNYTFYESASDLGNRFVPVLNGSTNDTNVTINYSSAKMNYGYILEVTPIDECGNIGSPTNSSPVIYVDLTPPTNPHIELIPSIDYTNSLSQIQVTWSFIDPESQNLFYEYCIVKPEAEDVCIYGPWYTNQTQVNITDLSLKGNETYEIRVRARNPSLIWSEYAFKSFTVDIDPPKDNSLIYTPGPLYYTNTINVQVDIGYDDLSGISRGEVYLMKAPLIVFNSSIGCGEYDDGTLIKTLYTNGQFSYNLTNGFCYKLFLRSFDIAGNFNDFFTFDDYYNGSILLDTTKPSKVTVFDESFATSQNTLFFNWTESEDPESGIKRYLYSLKDNLGNEIAFGETSPTTREIRLDNLSLINGMTYYLSVIAENHLGLQSDISTSDGIIYLDRLPPEKAIVLNISGGNYNISGTFYDLSSEPNTTVSIFAEDGANCMFSDLNLGYTELYKLGDCVPKSQNEFECSLPTPTEGVYTYYIACKDAAGNKQSPEDSLKVDLIKSWSFPSYQIIEPNSTQDAVFMPEIGEFLLNLTTFSPINAAKITLSNATDTLLVKNFNLLEKENESGQYYGHLGLDLTSFSEDLLTLLINVTDIFNRSTIENYSLLIVRDKPSYVLRGFSKIYSKKKDLTLNITSYLFNNLSINITRSNDQLMFSYNAFSENVSREKNILVPLNFTNSSWTEDKYTLNIFLFNNKSKENVTNSFDFIIDDTAPQMQQLAVQNISSENYDTDNLIFKVRVAEDPIKNYPSGINSVIIYYNETLGSEVRTDSRELTVSFNSSEYQIWEIKFLPGTFKPGSIINYTLQVQDNAGNINSYKNQFNISNRAPEFVTETFEEAAYQDVEYSTIIYVNDSDLYKNISCTLDTTFPTEAYNDIDVVAINNSACRVTALTNRTDYVMLLINLSDGLVKVNRSYVLSVKPTHKVSLNLSRVHHLVEVEALFNDTFISEGRYQSSTNLTLPEDNTSLAFKHENIVINTDKRFYAYFNNLTMTFLNMPTTFINSNELDLGMDKRFVPKSAYVIEFNKTMNYTISFNYSGLISNPNAAKIFKMAYDYDKDFINYSDTVQIADYSVDASKSLISFAVQNFSLFVLTEDTEYTPPTPQAPPSRHSRRRTTFVPKPTCNDSIKNQNETDIDCGGVCAPCYNGKQCLLDSDCYSGYCNPETKICENAPTCNDNIKNQDETDIDCGGPCRKCGAGKHCVSDADCLSNYCYNGVCKTPTCRDGIKNQGETDIDCGGLVCGKCEDGKSCNSSYDCLSKKCINNICVKATCDDGIKNQDETDIDCGGSCKPCPEFKVCKLNSDCLSNYCYNSVCKTPTCNDGIKNQGEEGVDCGGPCPRCETQQPKSTIRELYSYVLLFVILLVAVISLILLVLRFSKRHTKRGGAKQPVLSDKDKNKLEQETETEDKKLNKTTDLNSDIESIEPSLSDRDKQIVITYLRNLVKKSIDQGMAYPEIKSTLIDKGYSLPEFLEIAKEMYIEFLKKRIKLKITEFKKRGLSDEEIIKRFKQFGFSEDEAKSFLQ